MQPARGDGADHARRSDPEEGGSMKFLCLAFGDEQKSAALTQDEMRTLGEKCKAYDQELAGTGRVVASSGLGWAAKSLRLKGGKLRITDGPFAEAKELVG